MHAMSVINTIYIQEEIFLPASILNERAERLQSKIGVALDLVANQIRHDSHIVAETAAHLDPDWLASAVRAPYRTHQRQ